ITKLSKRAKAVIPSKRKLEILKSRKKETKELEDLRKEQQEQTSTERDSLTKTHIESENQRAARKILAMDRESSGKHTDNECISTLRGKTINSDKDNQESIKKDKNKSSSTTELDQKFLETIPKPSKNTEEITEEITEDALMQDNSFIVDNNM
ncbi:11614_t:CDS:2, partial [Gigaspora rosea]